ncbi:capsule assembly Wzi family protein [Larkinella insperata]|uniref:Capsule assembly Wzi family protein n=1 Tax=Larkinella insperata TaxID=332158 RepID=A0ABW3Q4L2_9BACT|nr:capsule assembly Wzi family protein [Larkinella insperata]
MQYHAEAGVLLFDGQQTPFWLRANQNGTVPVTQPAASLRLGVASGYTGPTTRVGQTKPKRFDWGYSLEVVGNTGRTSQLLLPEAYMKARYSFIEVYAGRRRGSVGLVDTNLTSGAYSWSGNALPLPTVQIGTPDYVSLGFLKHLIAFRAFYNHGWFENDGKKVTHSYLHQKVLYVRLGKPSWKVKLFGGFNHQVQWGGYSTSLDNTMANNGVLPHDLQSYIFMVTGYRHPNEKNTSLSAFENNRIGNHLGSVDLGMTVDLGHYNVFAYRQNLYDDGSLFRLTNIRDGLNGIRLRNNRPTHALFSIREALVEYLYTKSQGGAIVAMMPALLGRDNYFNNSQYIDGWIYKQRALGTPFLTPGTEVRPGLPNGAIANNRISMLHVGLTGQLAQVQWMTKISFSNNFGTYDAPFPDQTTQLSALLNLAAPVTLPVLGPVSLNSSLALDRGKLLPSSTGFYLGLRKTLTHQPRTVATLDQPK